MLFPWLPAPKGHGSHLRPSAALLGIAVAANRRSRWTRVPDSIVLLLIGVGLGAVLKWTDPRHFGATIRSLGMLALILMENRQNPFLTADDRRHEYHRPPPTDDRLIPPGC
jgi:hypothetical protein